MYQLTWKAPIFEWGTERKEALQQVQAVVQSALPFEAYNFG